MRSQLTIALVLLAPGCGVRGDLSAETTTPQDALIAPLPAVVDTGTEVELLDTGPQDTAPDLPVLGSGKLVLAGGGDHTCAIVTEGPKSVTRLYCFGGNAFGELGDGSKLDRLAAVRSLNVTHVAVGTRHTCGMNRTGPICATSPCTVVCVGGGFYGQLGGGTFLESSTTPVPVSLSGATTIAAGANHTCAITRTGTVACWGANESGQLGDGTTTNRASPVEVVGLNDVVQLSLGERYSCARTSIGAAYCFGSFGVAGTTLAASTAHRVDVPPMKKLSAGNAVCGVDLADQVWCWPPTMTNRTDAFVRLDELPPARDIAVGPAGGLCAITIAGSRVMCRGVPLPERDDWVTFKDLAPAGSVTVGKDRGCVTAGAVYCWGLNYSGALGIGIRYSADVPTPVRVLTSEP